MSRAALEVLSVISYHQPVTRAEIENIRSVETMNGTLDTLMETECTRMGGRCKVAGRPVAYGATDKFLDHFGFEEIRDLPGIEELKRTGLLFSHVMPSFTVLLPPANPNRLIEDEDPLMNIDF